MPSAASSAIVTTLQEVIDVGWEIGRVVDEGGSDNTNEQEGEDD